MKYPIGIQNFEKVRREGFAYVDKTAMIHQLAAMGSYYILSRPRRFGKSLLITTLEAYFSGKRELFKGLDMERLKKDWTPYPILHLDLKTGRDNNVEALTDKLESHLYAWEERYGRNPVMLCHTYIRRHLDILIPKGSERRYDNKRISILLNNGVPMGLQFSITGIGIIMLQSANNALGTVYVAAFTASLRIKYLFTCVLENIGVAMATYCGQNIGAHALPRVSVGVRSAMKIMLVYFVLTVLVIYPFADEMMMLFVKSGEQEVVSNAAMFMRLNNYFYPALGILVILRYSIQGLGYSNLSMLSGVMEMIARCGVSLWLVPAFDFLGVCFGDPVAWLMADLFLIPAFCGLYRKLKKENGNDSKPTMQ